jgi:hypothetical protein
MRPPDCLVSKWFLFEFVALRSRPNGVKGLKDYEDETF